MRWKTIAAIGVALVLTNCSGTTAPGSDEGAVLITDTLENVYHLRGILFQNIELYGDTAVLSWRAFDSTGNLILFDTVKVDTLVFESPFIVFIPHYYFPDKVYRLEFKSDSSRAIVYGRTPPVDSIKITYPNPGDTVQAGDTITIAWEYFGSPYATDSVHLWIYGEGAYAPCHYAVLPPYTTSYRFDTNECSDYSTIYIVPSVMYHNSLEPEGAQPDPLTGKEPVFLFGINGRSVPVYLSQ